jgi:hypothetical protein
MAAPGPHKAADSASLHSTGHDSAIQVGEHDHVGSHTAHASDEPVPQHDAAAQQDDDQFQDYVSDSGFDSGSLLEDETDTLASSIMNYRMENGRQYHAYRDGAYWGVSTLSDHALCDVADAL